MSWNILYYLLVSVLAAFYCLCIRGFVSFLNLKEPIFAFMTYVLAVILLLILLAGLFFKDNGVIALNLSFGINTAIVAGILLYRHIKK